MFERLFCIGLLLAASTGATQAQVNKAAPPTRKKATQNNVTRGLPFADARDMTLLVVYAPPNAVFPRQVGSAVWIGKQGYVVTCWHVIASLPGPFKIGLAHDPVVTEGEVGANISNVVTLVDADLIASDPGTDVAILKANRASSQLAATQQMVAFLGYDKPPVPITPQTPITPRGATLNTDLPKAGETLLLAGFPLSQNTLVFQTGVATGFISNPQIPESPPASKLRIMISLVSNPGNSGGPVLDEDGKLRGLLEGNLNAPVRDEKGRQVLSPRVKLDDAGNAVLDARGQQQFEIAPLQQNSGISFAVPARFIEQLAKKNNIDLR